MAYSTMYFSLPLIFLLFISEVNPKFSLREPKPERVVPGTNEWPLTKFLASLCCHVNTTLRVGVEILRSHGGWKKIGGAIKKPSESHWISNLDGRKHEITSDGCFVIRNVTRVDNGSVYKFNVLGLDAGNQPALIKLVYSPPELNEPIITEQSPTPVIVTENETTTLFCKSSGNPPPTTTWTKDGIVLHEGVNFTLKKIKREQEGNYTCTVQNGIGKNANASIPLTVHYPSSIEVAPSDQTVLEGSNIFLRLIATGNPKPTTTWFKDHNPKGLHEGEILFLPNIQKQAEGVYKFTVQNGIGKPRSGTVTLVVKSYDMTTTANTGSSIFKWLGIGVLVGFALTTIIGGNVYHTKFHHFCCQKKSYTVTQDDDWGMGPENLEMKKCGPGQNPKCGGPSGVQESQMTTDMLPGYMIQLNLDNPDLSGPRLK